MLMMQDYHAMQDVGGTSDRPNQEGQAHATTAGVFPSLAHLPRLSRLTRLARVDRRGSRFPFSINKLICLCLGGRL